MKKHIALAVLICLSSLTVLAQTLNPATSPVSGNTAPNAQVAHTAPKEPMSQPGERAQSMQHKHHHHHHKAATAR
jgi:hypothetical protein